MRCLLDTNVFYDVLNGEISLNKLEHETLYISPLTIFELFISTRPFEMRKRVASIIFDMFPHKIRVLPDPNYALARHYRKRIKYNADNNINLVAHLKLLSQSNENDSTLLWYINYIRSGYFRGIDNWMEVVNKLKKMIVEYYNGNLEEVKLTGVKLDAFRNELGVLIEAVKPEFNKIMIDRINEAFNKTYRKCRRFPKSLVPYFELFKSYVIDLIEQKSTPKPTDYVDYEHFIYVELFINMIVSNDGKWTRLAQNVNCEQYISYPF